jgi:3-methyladenine DNA glycosylase/8-oxoguanine DNA glycosylase
MLSGHVEVVPRHPLFGDDDPGHDVTPRHDAVTSAMRIYGAYRVPRTGTPYHDLLPAVLGQRVTAAEALAQWAEICRRFGRAVDANGRRMHAPPEPDALLAVPYHEFHLMGIDRRRAETLRNVARHGERLLQGWRTEESPHDRTMSLTLIEGVGVWTASVAGYASFCDPDALEVGDFHVKNTVAFALTGRHRGTDEEMCALLEPYAGQRQRVVTWLGMAGWRAPAHGPRRRIVRIARL